MPISINKITPLVGMSQYQKVLSFLRENGGQAYTVEELESILKVKNKYLRWILSTEKKKGIITHKRPFWYHANQQNN